MTNDDYEHFNKNIWGNVSVKKETYTDVMTVDMLSLNEIEVKDEPTEDYENISTLNISHAMINKKEELTEFPTKHELNINNQKIFLNTVENSCEDIEEFSGKIDDDKWAMEIGEYKVSWRDEMEDFVKKEFNRSDYMESSEMANQTVEDIATGNFGTKITEGVNSMSIERPFECGLCNKRFKLRHHLKTHQLTHLKEKKFHCTHCDYKSNYKVNVMKHFQGKHTSSEENHETLQAQPMYLKAGLILFFPNPNTGEKRYKCSKCEYETNSIYDISRHLSVHNEMRAYECDICKKRFKRLQYLKDHQLNHFSEKKYHCMHCNYKTNYKSCITTHLENKRCRNNGEYKCVKCDYKGFSNTDLSNHLITHFNQLPEQSTAKNDLHLRLENSSKEKKYKCLKCDYETKYERYLDKHLLVHSDIRPHECSTCNKRFKQLAHLKNHEVIHLKRDTLNCIHCNYKTNSKEYLIEHLKNKHPDKDEINITLRSENTDINKKKCKCLKCGYQTNRKSYLNKHLLMHNDLRPYECENCGNRFKSSYELKMHGFVHSGEKKFQCPYCDYKCVKNYYLQIHLKDKHSENEEKEYKCSKCQYQTNFAGNFRTHIQKHLRNT